MAIKINIPSKQAKDIESVVEQLDTPKKDSISSLAHSIKEKSVKEQEQLLDITGEGTGIESVQSAIGYLKDRLADERIDAANLELGLKQTLKLLKTYEDTILELEPEDINLIVDAAMTITDAELKAVFETKNKSKSKSKSKVDKSTKTLLEAAKGEPQCDVSDLDLDSIL